jgi:flavin-dependent dehydrogenase
LNSATLFSPSGNSFHLFRQEPQACVLDRAAFDISMAERAQRAGAEYSFNRRVTGITIENDRAVITASRHDKDWKIPARVAIIAGGFAPALNERAGLGAPKDYVTGAQVETATP